MHLNKSITYKDAGVDVEAGNELVERIKPLARNTFSENVISNIGGFSSFFALPTQYKNPVLVSSTDGVGTKLRLAIETKHYDCIGIDLVAMCVNDILVNGAEPLFFLDYLATAKLEVDIAEKVIKGIARGCKIAGCALIGGETAEMPGFYNDNDFDLAGFVVGIAEKAKLVSGQNIKAGDKLIAIASSGAHANGFSLIRELLHRYSYAVDDALVEKLMLPTKIYSKSIKQLLNKIPIHGMAHITGGGLTENIPRILPPKTAAIINCKSWQMSEEFVWLQEKANISLSEMYTIFNCGIGMVVCVPEQYLSVALDIIHNNGDDAWELGKIQKLKKQVVEFV